MLTTRKQVNHGNVRNRQQCNTSWSHQELQVWGAHASILNNNAKTAESTDNSQEAHIGQWSARIPERKKQVWIKNANRNSTTRHTPQKFSTSGNKKFQGTLPQFPLRYNPGFSDIIVGQNTSTGRNNNQPVASVQCNSKRFGIHPSERTLWL